MTLRAFHVRLVAESAHSGLVVREASFEAAALAFLERDAPAGGAEAAVIVCEAETGHERCFRIDLASGAARPDQTASRHDRPAR
jgi:hypothetical protein